MPPVFFLEKGPGGVEKIHNFYLFFEGFPDILITLSLSLLSYNLRNRDWKLFRLVLFLRNFSQISYENVDFCVIDIIVSDMIYTICHQISQM